MRVSDEMLEALTAVAATHYYQDTPKDIGVMSVVVDGRKVDVPQTDVAADLRDARQERDAALIRIRELTGDLAARENNSRDLRDARQRIGELESQYDHTRKVLKACEGDYKARLKDAIRRAEEAEQRARGAEYEVNQKALENFRTMHCPDAHGMKLLRTLHEGLSEMKAERDAAIRRAEEMRGAAWWAYGRMLGQVRIVAKRETPEGDRARHAMKEARDRLESTFCEPDAIPTPTDSKPAPDAGDWVEVPPDCGVILNSATGKLSVSEPAPNHCKKDNSSPTEADLRAAAEEIVEWACEYDSHAKRVPTEAERRAWMEAQGWEHDRYKHDYFHRETKSFFPADLVPAAMMMEAKWDKGEKMWVCYPPHESGEEIGWIGTTPEFVSMLREREGE
jgi:hypothetical protein